MTRLTPRNTDDVKGLEGEKPPLNWDGGKRETPTNRGAGDPSSPAGREFSGGTRGPAGGKNQEQEALVRGKPLDPSPANGGAQP